ncbi:peptide chain release factor N(5)-glutamine methyltransferase [Marnyiella aurantia]|uniref:Release factor glutamine methyltransferase n=1 Tax=Marnyiella aurantia TaxID=2758037 RepID=A0A7D7LN15_9FLAO|nr:peptide chain release factor N(5)-glutamine methyltransferase [Marnyiella aurantia]MBA5245733.1 peptide chain release factor N(5)-glutamine methyltransferase [Marnyiella aurantia]QMS98862.1 peptide chain release factor N(5)-glutamine methyltransferase [Marnyiella aurantia]
MGTLKDIKSDFQEELSQQYSVSETEVLFEIFSEEWLGLNRLQLRAALQNPLETETEGRFKDALGQLRAGVPYQQILGKALFYGLNFVVDNNVLIPRPETEELMEIAVAELQLLTERSNVRSEIDNTSGKYQLRIIDIGTGSGAIAITLKKQFPEAVVYAVDYSEAALQTAAGNAVLHETEINFIHMDYLNSELQGKFDLIISNPPYIGRDEADEIADSVKEFEPKMALFSPVEDALIFYRKIAADSAHHLAEQGIILLEINQKLGPETLELFKEFPSAELLKDLSGNDRFIRVVI